MRTHRRSFLSAPLDEKALDSLALAYVGRFATTAAKLTTYLERKLFERGWSGGEPPIADIVTRFVEAGYVDDAAFAQARSCALARRGYGSRRIGAALIASGIDPSLASAFEHDDAAAFDAALAFAKRRRIGPFARVATDESARKRALAAMARAGHSFALARLLVGAEPGTIPDRESLRHNWSEC